MSAIKLVGFIGEQPHVVPTLLPANASTAAINVRLDDGALTPIRKPVRVSGIADAAHQTILKWGGDWLSFAGLVHAVPGPVAADRLYRTDGVKPKLRVAGTDYDLALPMVAGALTATLGGSGSGDTVTRIYVYTWLTDFGEESAPNPVSNAIDWKPGNTVTLSGFAAAPSGRNITKQRIYRSQSGQSGTYFYLIAERAASNATFSDTVAVDAFAEPLPSAGYSTPPDALEGLVAMPNGIMAGFVDRSLRFSEPYRPHAWPVRYELITDYPIMALGAVGGSLVVVTAGVPYLVTGSSPSSMQMQRIEQNLPCINKRSVANLGFALCYASHEGLVAVDGAGTARLVSANLFNRDGWAVFNPATIVGGQMSGRYVAFYDTVYEDKPLRGALFIDVGTSPFLIRADAVAQAAFHEIGSGALYLLDKGTTDVVQLDAPDAAREAMYWRSKEFVLPAPDNFGAIMVRAKSTLNGDETAAIEALIAAVIASNAAKVADGSIGGDLGEDVLGAMALGGDTLEDVPEVEGTITVGIIADGERKAQIAVTNRPARLPSGFKATVWEIDVAGDQQVREIVLAKTMQDLQQVAPS